MKAKHHESILRLAREISDMASDLPISRRHQIQNRCNKIKVITKKAFNNMETFEISCVCPPEDKDRYIAKKAILEALLAGRRLSQLDCREFRVEDMRTPISHLRNHFPETHELKKEWMKIPGRNVRIKEYYLERRAES